MYSTNSWIWRLQVSCVQDFHSQVLARQDGFDGQGSVDEFALLDGFLLLVSLAEVSARQSGQEPAHSSGHIFTC